MISNNDRMGWIGASDTRYFMGSWTTETFRHWWQIKQGLTKGMFNSVEMKAGTMWESTIADYVMATSRDKQVIREDLKLRVNLDAELNGSVCEIKTHKAKAGWKPSKAYWYQVQAEMFANEMTSAVIVAYGLEDEDYFEVREIDPSRITYWMYEIDMNFIDEEYLPRVRYLASCLERGMYPNEGEFEKDRAGI